jgi:hypothetical protein
MSSPHFYYVPFIKMVQPIAFRRSDHLPLDKFYPGGVPTPIPVIPFSLHDQPANVYDPVG